jgi:hypothetical protein
MRGKSILENRKKLKMVDREDSPGAESNRPYRESSKEFCWPLPNGKIIYYQIT